MDADVTVVLNGVNKLRTTQTGIGRKGSVTGNLVTIKGDGSLRVETDNFTAVDLWNLTVESGTITLNNGSVNVIGGIIMTGDKLNINTVNNVDWNDGVYATGGISITGGTLNVQSGRAGLLLDPRNNGTVSGIRISGGDVTVSGQFGVYAFAPSNGLPDANISITGGTVAITTSTAGIRSQAGELEIKDCNITIDSPTPYNVTSGTIAIGEADYSELDALVAQIPQDPSLYTEETIQVLQEALDGIITGKNLLEQEEVDAMAEAVRAALGQLTYRQANYDAIDELLQKVPEDVSGYTEETVQALRAAIDGIIRGKTIVEQDEVDLMAEALKAALDGLKLKATEEPVPTVPSDTATPDAAGTANTDVPKTGDSGAAIYTALAVMGVSAAAILVVLKKKSAKSGR